MHQVLLQLLVLHEQPAHRIQLRRGLQDLLLQLEVALLLQFQQIQLRAQADDLALVLSAQVVELRARAGVHVLQLVVLLCTLRQLLGHAGLVLRQLLSHFPRPLAEGLRLPLPQLLERGLRAGHLLRKLLALRVPGAQDIKLLHRALQLLLHALLHLLRAPLRRFGTVELFSQAGKLVWPRARLHLGRYAPGLVGIRLTRLSAALLFPRWLQLVAHAEVQPIWRPVHSPAAPIGQLQGERPVGAAALLRRTEHLARLQHPNHAASVAERPGEDVAASDSLTAPQLRQRRARRGARHVAGEDTEQGAL
mmetsp:Transcript_83939/g.216028  ORF Transcript_83939/g.216028 Transcript_83939/m.216028 type:complete len:307 (-) Transcript_83939:466-1386(-)